MWTKGHELKYWNKNGLKKGTGIYPKYRESFSFDEFDFEGKKIADIGCGPLGGCFCGLSHLDVTLIDILAKEYSKMNASDRPIVCGDLSRQLPFDDASFDFVVCTNAIDHIPNVRHGFREIYRILKEGGIAFVHVHLRTKAQLNKAHIHVLDLKRAGGLAKKVGFGVLSNKEDTDWVNDRADRQAAYMVLNK